MNTSVLALCLCCIVLLRAGQMLFDSGVSRSKNAASAVLRSICDMATAGLAFWAVGAAILLQGRNDVFALDWRLLVSDDPRLVVFLPFVLLASGQVAGTIAERARFAVVPVLSVVMAVLVVPIIGHWTWQGFLGRNNVLDLGGALPLHLASSTAALVAAVFIGPRTGKYNRDGSTNGIPGHSLVLMGSGTMLMFFGWLVYLTLAASLANVSLPHTVVNGLLAASAGALGAMAFSAIRYAKSEVLLTLLGLVAGLASTTAALGVLPTWSAVLLGAVAGVAACYVGIWLELRMKVDEASGFSSAIGVGALVSLLGSPMMALSSFKVSMTWLGMNTLGALVTVATAGALTWGCLWLTQRLVKVRASEAEEYDGLDLAEHDVNAYPDFQQTMIKSYHMREA